MIWLKVFLRALLIFILTVITQVGGIVYLIHLPIAFRIKKYFSSRVAQVVIQFACFITLYLLFVFAIVPAIAKPFGRVRLPMTQSRNLKPGTILTVLLNRNYVRPELRATAFHVSEEMSRIYPDIVVNYLDANFPFINGFPLFPHLSHNDGKKLDLAFEYVDQSGIISKKIPSLIGYGVCEAPRLNEENKPEECAKNGYWQYNLLSKLMSNTSNNDLQFDEAKTKRLVELFARDQMIKRIFIEPHLKTRLGLSNSKVVFHGCHAVRHDDHFHVQLN